ncbi:MULTISPECIES: beta-N-acetylhexosaminidase [unclassified Streptomyces]|uniref:beta-N-acetylhexosaminidase n=1 Tax=unclassified Streptomyces TaxID=2593676 RepID=UPI001BE92800|nr:MULTISPECIES: beta-N-acetylhexosaminidase [unclassified Streptomyces]MBT2402591.1 beta-N-acetylhexosaminidase [Streptomyces sp. ISL-21]MBT2607984.1 beta-N-acetylhexosaminidase [Streptomyces sp. ISL-87]
MRVLRRTLGTLLVLGAAVSCTAAHGDDAKPRGERPAALAPYERLLPAPASVRAAGPGYAFGAGTVIRTGLADGAAADEVRQVGELLAEQLRGPSGLPLPVVDAADDKDADGIRLRLDEDAAGLGREGYRLETAASGVTLTARTPAGLFHAGQTLRQLVPLSGPGTVPGGTVTDAPRFAYRGAMLDIARHFFTVEQVKRYVDQLAQYKVNALHLHLTDDQGWRIAIDAWPRLAEYGGGSEVGGGPGGYWTKEDYRELVAYAGARYVDVVPEIDMPGHVNAAQASYAELNCDGKARERYTGIKVGFSSLCVGKERTYEFVDEVLGELARLTPGRYLHIGGDEALSTPAADYAAFMDRAQKTVGRYGKTVVAWHQLATARPAKGAVLQYWGHDRTAAADKAAVAAAAKAGHPVILSPADRLYLDMKYDRATKPGLAWAGYVPVQRAYAWNPGSYLPGVAESSVLGVEAPLWTETIGTRGDLEYMAFPRVLGLSELGWSPASALDWTSYRQRLSAQGPRLDAQDITFYRAPDVPWS